MGQLNKLAARQTKPHVLGERRSASSWEVVFQGGKVQQVHPNHLQKYD